MGPLIHFWKYCRIQPPSCFCDSCYSKGWLFADFIFHQKEIKCNVCTQPQYTAQKCTNVKLRFSSLFQGTRKGAGFPVHKMCRQIQNVQTNTKCADNYTACVWAPFYWGLSKSRGEPGTGLGTEVPDLHSSPISKSNSTELRLNKPEV